MTAASVARFLGRAGSHLVQLYPSLYRRQATRGERRFLAMHGYAPQDAPIVTLLLADEVNAIVEADESVHLLRRIPEPQDAVVRVNGVPVRLVRSNTAPFVPPRPPDSKVASRPHNPLAQFYQ